MDFLGGKWPLKRLYFLKIKAAGPCGFYVSFLGRALILDHAEHLGQP